MTTLQILQAARALIEAGWCKCWDRHERADGGVDYCIVGALSAVAGLAFEGGPALDALYRALPPGLDDVEGIEAFNDDPRTTKRRVLALFDRALIAVTK